MRRFSGVLVLLLLGSQLAHGQDRQPFGPPAIPAVKPNPICNGRTFVLFADSASDSIDAQSNLASALECSSCPPLLRYIPWAVSDNSVANYVSRPLHLAGAAMILTEVQRIHQYYPASAIVLIGYCAGANVVLYAAEQLPPGSIDRIVLLSPAVSSFYDPRLALRASRCGIDVFYSSDDSVLEFKETQYGAADGMQTITAGRVGFVLAKCNGPLAGDPRLRQFDVAQGDVSGGHFATVWTFVLRRYVVPLFPCGPCGGLPPGPGLPPGVPPNGPPPGPPVPPPGPNVPAPNGPPGPNVPAPYGPPGPNVPAPYGPPGPNVPAPYGPPGPNVPTPYGPPGPNVPTPYGPPGPNVPTPYGPPGTNVPTPYGPPGSNVPTPYGSRGPNLPPTQPPGFGAIGPVLPPAIPTPPLERAASPGTPPALPSLPFNRPIGPFNRIARPGATPPATPVVPPAPPTTPSNRAAAPGATTLATPVLPPPPVPPTGAGSSPVLPPPALN